MTYKRGPGRPSRFAHYDQLRDSLKAGEKKRPTYVNGVGLLKGARDTTVFLKFTLPRPNAYRGRSYAAGEPIEIKLGSLASWTWEQLEAERTRLKGLADRGEPLEEVPTVTFAACAAEWLDLKKGQAGWGVANGHVASYLLPAFGKKALSDISIADVDRWVAQQRRTLKPATVHRQMATLKSILNYAVKIGQLERNPASRAEPIRGIEGRQRYLSPDERSALFEVVAAMEAESASREKYANHEIKGWLPDFLDWALQSGMRRNEILRLKLSDIKRLPKGNVVALVGKTKSGQPRGVGCTPKMVEIAERWAAHTRIPGDDRLFPVSETTVKRRLTKLWKMIGTDIRLHDLRRTHATELVNAGVNLREISARIGHSDLSMLEKHYAVYLGDGQSVEKAQQLFARE